MSTGGGWQAGGWITADDLLVRSHRHRIDWIDKDGAFHTLLSHIDGLEVTEVECTDCNPPRAHPIYPQDEWLDRLQWARAIARWNRKHV